eukprot:gene19902-26605_t
MVDVSEKASTRREARASACVLLGREAFQLVRENKLKKGDVLSVAQLAGIMGSKHTSTLIPLCHNINISKVDVSLSLDEPSCSVRIQALAICHGTTGVEMEALTAASVAALTVYDMCKAVSKSIIISDIRLDNKSGGKSYECLFHVSSRTAPPLHREPPHIAAGLDQRGRSTSAYNLSNFLCSATAVVMPPPAGSTTGLSAGEAKTRINTFAKRVGIDASYVTNLVPDPAQPTKPLFQCRLTLPACSCEGERMDEQVFVGTGGKKKDAEGASAKVAGLWLEQQLIFGVAMPPPPPKYLWHVTSQILSNEGLQRNEDVAVLLLDCLASNSGWLPLGLLLQGLDGFRQQEVKPIQQWMKAKHASLQWMKAKHASLVSVPVASWDRDMMAVIMQQHMKEEEEEQALLHPSIELSPDSLAVRRVHPYKPHNPESTSLPLGAEPAGNVTSTFKSCVLHLTRGTDFDGEDVHMSGTETSKCQAIGVLVPSCCSLPVVEVSLQAGGSLLTSLSSAFSSHQRIGDTATANATEINAQSNINRLVFHGSVGHRCYRVAYPQAPGEGSSTVQQSMEGIECSDAGGINLRASWLAGHAVRGDALFCLCKPTTSRQAKQLAILWSDYTQADFWITASSIFTASDFALHSQAPLLGSLPAKYKAANCWSGASPTSLLKSYVARQLAWQRHTPTAPAASLPADQQTGSTSPQQLTFECFVGDADEPVSSTTARVTVSSFKDVGEVVVADAGPYEIAGAAEQQAALRALHTLQALDREVLLGSYGQQASLACKAHGAVVIEASTDKSPASADISPASADTCPASADTSPGVDVVVMDEGNCHRRKAVDGNMVKVSYRLYLDAGWSVSTNAAPPFILKEPFLLERSSVSFILGSKAVLPELEAAAAAVHVGGEARVRVMIAAQGPDPLNIFQHHPAVLDVAVREVSVPSVVQEGDGGSVPTLFSPSLATQRMEIVRKLMVQQGACSLVDAGCGDASLLVHLITSHRQQAAAKVSSMEVDASKDGDGAKKEATPPDEVGKEATPPEGGASSMVVDDSKDGDGAKKEATPPDEVGKEATPPEGGASSMVVDDSKDRDGASKEATPPEGGASSMEVGDSKGGDDARKEATPPEGGASSMEVDDSKDGDGASKEATPPGDGVSKEAKPCEDEAIKVATPPYPPLRLALGVDISLSGTSRACKRLENLKLVATDPQVDRGPAPATIAVYCGSALGLDQRQAAGWGHAYGCDAAVMIEVVEHLDPDVLSCVGPCLHGGLSPGMLIVTTPNWEYNAVLRAVEEASRPAGKGGAGPTWPGPPGRDGLPLRCNDHRFEWTRREFQDWAGCLAHTYGYEVRFEGVGRCGAEPQVLGQVLAQVQVGESVGPSASSGAEAEVLRPVLSQGGNEQYDTSKGDLGFATQIAVFTRTSRVEQPAYDTSQPAPAQLLLPGNAQLNLVWGPSPVSLMPVLSYPAIDR